MDSWKTFVFHKFCTVFGIKTNVFLWFSLIFDIKAYVFLRFSAVFVTKILNCNAFQMRSGSPTIDFASYPRQQISHCDSNRVGLPIAKRTPDDRFRIAMLIALGSRSRSVPPTTNFALRCKPRWVSNREAFPRRLFRKRLQHADAEACGSERATSQFRAPLWRGVGGVEP